MACTVYMIEINYSHFKTLEFVIVSLGFLGSCIFKSAVSPWSPVGFTPMPQFTV